MADNNKQENKTEELLEKQKARQLTEEDLEQVTGGGARCPRLVINGSPDYKKGELTIPFE